jgi:hypothetical protein
MWTRKPRTRLLHTKGLDDGPEAEWSAEHDGYGRLSPPVLHRRTVRLNRLSKKLVIEDRVECPGRQSYRLAFHLGPNIACALADNVARLSWNIAGSECHAELFLPPGLHWCSIKGQVDPPTGWYSPAFGVKCPATTLIGTVTTDGDFDIKTELQMAVRNDIRTAETSGIDQVSTI